MTRDDIRRRLDQAGQAPTPPVDAAFADALEQRLRAVHATLPAARDAASATPHPGTAPVRAWWRSPVPVAAAMALLLVVGVGSVLSRPTGVELASAFDAVVTLPDGRSVAARAGQRLAEGTVVLIGPSGHVESEGVRLGPGEAAVVRDDRLQPIQRTQDTPPPRDQEPREQPSRKPAVALPPLPSVGRPAPDREQPEEKPSEMPEDRTEAPAPEDKPTSAAVDRAPDDTVVDGTSEPDATHAIGLSAKLGDGHVFLSWTEFRHPDFAMFLVLRSPDPATPTWPPSKDTEPIAGSGSPDSRRHIDGDPPSAPVYRIVAVDRDGRELARSAPVRPDAPEERGQKRPVRTEAFTGSPAVNSKP